MGMGTETIEEKRERLSYILEILNALIGVAARDGSPMLRYFVQLAAAQARDEHAALKKVVVLDEESRIHAALH
jgi:hypothetical protein